MAVTITKAPTFNVQGVVAPNRRSASSFEMVASWSIPGAGLDQNRADRAEYVDIFWDLNLKSKTSSTTKKVRIEQRQAAAKTGTQAMNPNGVVAKDRTQWFRTSYYPHTDWTLTGVTAYVHTRNSKGAHKDWVPATRKFALPKPPNVSTPAEDESTGRVTAAFAMVVPAQAEFSEARVHRWRLEKYDSRTKATEVKTGELAGAVDGSTAYFDIADWAELANTDDYVRVTARDYSKGYVGDSKEVIRELYVSFPRKPVITGVDIPSSSPTDYVVVRFRNNQTKEHPVTGVRLEYLANTEYEDASSIPGTEEWTSHDVVDNGDCVALSALVQSMIPSPGNHSWVRVRTWNRFEGKYSSYSEPYRLVGLESEEPTVGDAGAVIAAALSGDDGRSAEVTLAWDGDDGASGTELSWSDSPHAWRSNDGPSAFEVGWSDGPLTVGGTTWPDSATVHVAGLTEGTRYWLRSRRYLDSPDADRAYGAYYPATGEVTVEPMTSPTTVVLTAPKYVAEGEAIPVSWSYDSGSKQVSWRLVTGEVENGVMSSAQVVVDSGTDSLGSHTIAPERAASLLAGGSAFLAVSVSTGGEPVTSQPVQVSLSVRPTVSVSVAQVTEQPMQAVLGTGTESASVVLVVTAEGTSGDSPRGEEHQAAGDTVWSDVVRPEWQGNGPYTATVTMPPALDLRDGAGYVIRAKAVDDATGLSSDTVEAHFTVDLARKAPSPSDVTSVEPFDVTEGGVRTIGARIDLVVPEDIDETDVMDVYRLTTDGPVAVATNVPAGSLVTDEHAPFGSGDLAYRVAVRTTDGSEEWVDIPYQLVPHSVFEHMVRLDFGGEYVELDRGVQLTDAYSKSFESRRHVDGTTSGYWERGTTRSASASTMAVRVYEEAQDRALRALARYEGPVLVRTSDGDCYEADVQVAGLGTSGTTAKETVSLRIQAVAPSEYVATYEEQE